MGLFDDIIKSAVKDTVAELLKEEIQAAQGAGNGDGESAPGAGNGETGDEKGAGGAADESPENASGTGEPENAEVKAVVKKMLEDELRAANAARLNATPASKLGAQNADEAMRDLLGLGKGE